MRWRQKTIVNRTIWSSLNNRSRCSVKNWCWKGFNKGIPNRLCSTPEFIWYCITINRSNQTCNCMSFYFFNGTRRELNSLIISIVHDTRMVVRLFGEYCNLQLHGSWSRIIGRFNGTCANARMCTCRGYQFRNICEKLRTPWNNVISIMNTSHICCFCNTKSFILIDRLQPAFYTHACNLVVGLRQHIVARKWTNLSSFLCLQNLSHIKQPKYEDSSCGFNARTGRKSLTWLHKPSIVCVCVPCVGST